ncbi:Uncharacterised protein [Mycoplasmopsis arginini]|nr:Uncharacterised protein [Chlamydia abortus]SGA11294.1 Uncharacterised protein [Mycoplasmopsis arginini]SGA18723.1 Uncharacterised protein [Mycoplasmopsis arginini]SGA32487.1 Uncharacterised protein [Chlamydia abortus]
MELAKVELTGIAGSNIYNLFLADIFTSLLAETFKL